jgi:hypothetical protein
MLNVIMLNVITQCVGILSGIMQSASMLSIFYAEIVMLNIIMMNVIMLSHAIVCVLMLSVIMLSIVAPKTDHYSYKGFAALVPGASF